MHLFRGMKYAEDGGALIAWRAHIDPTLTMAPPPLATMFFAT
jgi:hypothetical protein